MSAALRQSCLLCSLAEELETPLIHRSGFSSSPLRNILLCCIHRHVESGKCQDNLTAFKQINADVLHCSYAVISLYKYVCIQLFTLIYLLFSAFICTFSSIIFILFSVSFKVFEVLYFNLTKNLKCYYYLWYSTFL